MVTVDFTGTPLTGSEPLGVSFTSTVTITQWGRGGEWTKKKKKYPKPFYYYQQAYRETLKDVPEPADAKTFDATVSAAVEINRVIEKLEKNDRDYDSMLRSFDAKQREVLGYIASETVKRKMDEARDFIQKAKDAEIARLLAEQEEERKDLEAFIDRMYGS